MQIGHNGGGVAGGLLFFGDIEMSGGSAAMTSPPLNGESPPVDGVAKSQVLPSICIIPSWFWTKLVAVKHPDNCQSGHFYHPLMNDDNGRYGRF